MVAFPTEHFFSLFESVLDSKTLPPQVLRMHPLKLRSGYVPGQIGYRTVNIIAYRYGLPGLALNAVLVTFFFFSIKLLIRRAGNN